MINLHYKEIDTLEDVYFYNLKSSKSPLLSIYYDQTELWTLLHRSITDTFLLKLMVFNLYFNISPVHVFIKYYQEDLKQLNLKRYDKQCIGYHIAFIFKSLGYKKTRQIYRKDAIIKYGGYYEVSTNENCTEEYNGSNHGNSGDLSET